MASVLIASHLKLPLELIVRLMWFGACYSCPVVPAPPPNSLGLDDEIKTKILAWRAAGIAKHGKDVSECMLCTGQISCARNFHKYRENC